MMVEVISAGILSTIQDQGRFGYRNIGVPISGVMDLASANLANAILNNNLNCAVLETTINGVVLRFYQTTFIAITGASCPLTINGKVIKHNTAIKIRANQALTIGKAIKGVRCYLAVAGGFQTKNALNSRSFYRGVTEKERIQKGDRLKTNQPTEQILNHTTISTTKNHVKIKATKAPEFDDLDQKLKEILLKSKFKVSPQSNRMAYKLEHNYNLQAKEIITSSVQPGTVQLTPSGELIVLMRDCQTTGGYARVLQLTETAINNLSQKRAGEFINFQI